MKNGKNLVQKYLCTCAGISLSLTLNAPLDVCNVQVEGFFKIRHKCGPEGSKVSLIFLEGWVRPRTIRFIIQIFGKF